MARKTGILLLAMTLLFISSSCWDQRPIEDQAFIIGLALDKGDDPDMIKVTFQIAQPQAFVTEAKSEESFWNISEEAEDITAAQNQLIRIMNLTPTLEHCQIILIGEELAREGLHDYLDFLLRTHEIRRAVRIGVVQGKAKDILDMKYKTDLMPSFVISEMMDQNSRFTFELSDFMNIGKLHTAFTGAYDFALVRIVPLEEKLDMSGGGIFKNEKLVGWLSNEEMMGLRFLRGDVGSGYLTVDLTEDLGKRAMLRIYESQSILEPEIRDNRLVLRLKIRAEGDITEIVYQKGRLSESEFLPRIENLFREDIEKKIRSTFTKLQQEYESDVFQLKEKLQSYYPEYWQQNAEGWDEIYRSARLEIEANVLVRRIGEIRY